MRKEYVWNDEEVQNRLNVALRVVKELDPPEDLRGDCFKFATQLLTQAQIGVSTVPVASTIFGDRNKQ